MRSLSIFLVVSFILITLYVISQILLLIYTGTSCSDVLTGCIFAFFGTEIASTAFIKIYKLKGGEKDENEQ